MDRWVDDEWIWEFSSVTKYPEFTEGKRMQMITFFSNNELSETLFFSLNPILFLSPYSLLPKRFVNITTNTNLTTNNDLSTNNVLTNNVLTNNNALTPNNDLTTNSVPLLSSLVNNKPYIYLPLKPDHFSLNRHKNRT